MPIPPNRKEPKPKAWTNREPLECCEFASLQRCLGVDIGEEFTHQGLKVQMQECTYETITVNTITYGGPKPVEDVESEKEAMCAKIVADINTVIDELTSHRARISQAMLREPLKSTRRGHLEPPRAKRCLNRK